jgi:ABC-type lipoprotein export system ATPase subunit
MSDIILRTEGLAKAYALPKGELRVFEGIDLELERGDLVAVMGVSGVGKTTLLNLLGALDRPTSGRIWLDGQDLGTLSEAGLSALRNAKIGFVFQFFHLLPEFTAAENVAFPLLIGGAGKREAFARARGMLEEVSLGDKADLRPGQLSGGEQQRVAVARALINEPRLLLADEPTGNLDAKTGGMVLEIILELHRKRGLSSIVVTHNERIAALCDKVLVMEAGALKPIPVPGR